VVHIYNPSYLGDGDQEDCSLKPARAKHYQDISTNKLCVLVHVCSPPMQVTIVGLLSEASPRQKAQDPI
jgi:hypothetical protein